MKSSPASAASRLLIAFALLGSSCHGWRQAEAEPARPATSQRAPSTASSIQPATAPSRASAQAAPQPPPKASSEASTIPAGLSRFLALGQRIGTFGATLSGAVTATSSPLDDKLNLGICPPSLYAALNLLARGARGQTRAEIEEALGTAGIDPAADEGVYALFEAFRRSSSTEDLVLETSTTTWVDSSLNVLPAFTAEAESLERSETRKVAFGTPRARREINTWVFDKTHGLVKELVPQGSLDGRTRLVLTNAIYFRSRWEKPFPRQGTANRPFTLASGEVRSVPTMKRAGNYAYTVTPSAIVVELPYRATGFSMLVVLPNNGAFSEAERQMSNPSYLSDVAGALHVGDIVLQLPRFRVETNWELGPALVALGIRKAFSKEADLSGLARSMPDPLRVNSVRHGVVIDVTEEQTEAAAATAVEVEAISAPAYLTVDRPFLFAIIHRATSTVLFSGRVVNPGA